jgi:hypothetical protein
MKNKNNYKILMTKMKNKKYHTVETIPKLNIKIVERGKIDTPSTQIHDPSLSWLGTGTLIKSGAGFELLVVIGTDCIGRCKSNYHTITTPTVPSLIRIHTGLAYITQSS